jgi:hypothetical protein
MAGPLAPEVEAPDAAVGAPHVMEPDDIDADGDAALAEDSAEVTNGSSAASEAEARRAERRRQQRAKRKHGRR